MGMEAPIVPYLIAGFMVVLGDGPETGRIVVWLLAAFGALCGTVLLRRELGPPAAVGFLLMLALSPMALFELRQLQPDGVVAMLGLVAALLFWRSSKDDRARDYWVGMVVYSAAVLAKGPGLFLAPAMWLFSVSCRGARRPITWARDRDDRAPSHYAATTSP